MVVTKHWTLKHCSHINCIFTFYRERHTHNLTLPYLWSFFLPNHIPSSKIFFVYIFCNMIMAAHTALKYRTSKCTPWLPVKQSAIILCFLSCSTCYTVLSMKISTRDTTSITPLATENIMSAERKQLNWYLVKWWATKIGPLYAKSH